MASTLANAALRAIPGAFILNSGLGKLQLDKDAYAHLQQMAVRGVPQVEDLDPQLFGKLLAGSEIALGSALLTPFLPNRLVGLGLGAFSAGLISMYLNTPGMTEDDGFRPTQEGISLAKDTWLAAIAVALIFQTKRKTRKKSR